jgi:site-specific DNA recombinase
MICVTERLNKYSRIAAYLRKSREDLDTEDTLSKHRLQLKEFIAKNGFKNVEFYEEIGSADSISRRPVFMELLDKVESGAFDAVLVVAFDRLTRGSQKDAGIINEIFKESDTLIVTPNRTYDLNEESSEMLSEFESLIARQEYRQIKKRLKQGKINGTKEGKFTNGKPPFPYYYDRNTRTVKVDENGRKIYNYLLTLFLEEGLSTEEIAQRFNVEGIPTISGKPNAVWRQSQTARLLKHEFHLGYVFHGKFRRVNGNHYRENDPSKIIKVKGHHEPLKNEEQHWYIVQRLEETRLVPHRARKGEYILSGISKCAFCGHGISWYRDPKNRVYLKKCRHILPDGINRCNKNQGCSEDVVLRALRDDMEDFAARLFSKTQDAPKRRNRGGKALIALQIEAIEKANQRIERIKELFIDGMIDRKEFEKRKKAEEQKIKAAEKEVERLSQSNEFIDEAKKKERMKRWTEMNLKELFEGNLSTREKNEGFKMLIERIDYKREVDKVELNVIYK